jgi:hypothetical protein
MAADGSPQPAICRNIPGLDQVVFNASEHRAHMKFARLTFLIAGVWGLCIVTPLYFLHDTIAQQHPSLLVDPQFFYSFLAVTIPWQLAFLTIGLDPMRLRGMMIPAMMEKFGYVLTITVLWTTGRAPLLDGLTAVPDGLIGVFFVIAFMKVGDAAAARR